MGPGSTREGRMTSGGAEGALADDAERADLMILEDHEGGTRRSARGDPGAKPDAEGVPGADERGYGLVGAGGGLGEGGGEPGGPSGLSVGGDEELDDGPIDRAVLGHAEQRLGTPRHGLNEQRAVDHQEGVAVGRNDVLPGLQHHPEAARTAHASHRRGRFVAA